MVKNALVVFIYFLVGCGGVLAGRQAAADDISSEQDKRFKIVEKVLESSLVGLKKSALEVSQRNRFLLNENKNLEGKIQELEKELKPLQGEKTPLPAADQDSLGTPAYEKLRAASLQEQITRLSKEKGLLEQENHKSEEQNRIKQEKFEKIRKSSPGKVTEINALRKKYDSLKTQKESSQVKGSSQEKKRLLSSIEEKKEKIEKLQRKKQKSGDKKDYSSSKGVDHLREKQNQIQEEVSKLEREISVISGDERRYLNQMPQIEQSRGAQLVQFNQEIDSLTSRKQELERTLVAAQERLKEHPLNLPSDHQPLGALQEKLNSLQQENQVLKAQIP